jgi:hypothetical protein
MKLQRCSKDSRESPRTTEDRSLGLHLPLAFFKMEIIDCQLLDSSGFNANSTLRIKPFIASPYQNRRELPLPTLHRDSLCTDCCREKATSEAPWPGGQWRGFW